MSEFTDEFAKPKLSSLHRQSSERMRMQGTGKASPSLSADSAHAAGPRGPGSGGFGKQFGRGRSKTSASLVQAAGAYDQEVIEVPDEDEEVGDVSPVLPTRVKSMQ